MNKYIIPIIKKEKEAETRRELRLPLYRDPPTEYEHKDKVEEKPKRGSTIIDLNISKGHYGE
tara:strand:+ start:2074 stop:2259 length:186 start_codon:yes stop_codon:yes gene_type:complete